MIPNYFIPLEELPLASTGKIDRMALPVPGGFGAGDEGGEYIASKDEIEKKLVRIWSEILGIEERKISATSNFFEIGGHSLSIITLISKIYNEFGIELPVTSLFKTPILREIAEQIKLASCAEDPVLLLNPSDSLSQKIIFCFPPGIGFGLSYKNLSYILKGYSLYSFNFIESEDRIKQYLEIIMGIQKTGPYILFGYSASGTLMMELGKQLENKGLEVSDIIFLDCIFAGNDKNTQGSNKKLNERVARNLEEKLNNMGVGFLKDKILKKTRKYMAYEKSITSLEVINTNIHLILSEETWNTPRSSCWDKFTTKKSSIYQGFGRHKSMLDPGILEKNAQIIQEILDKIEV
jgi:thioesterase domain-containing protein/acyl carrier protein